MKKLFLSLALTLLTLQALADGGNDFFEQLQIRARVGYNLGGTAPVPLPESIRKLNSFTPQYNFVLGVEAEEPLSGRFGLLLGLKFENKGMKEDAEVKDYQETIIRGGEQLSGRFTGDVETKVTEWMFTIPVQATYSFSPKWKLRFGPYVSILTSKHFEGNAHNGYLRQGDPTGPKVVLGDDSDTKGYYDFSSDMRKLQWGLSLGADWYFGRHWGAYAGLDWGLSGVFNSSFNTIEQTLYPIFGTFGLTYTLK